MAETVELAIPSSSAISGPVNRRRRNAATAATRSAACAAAADAARRSGTQTREALSAVAGHPLARGAAADAGGLGRRRQPPALLADTRDQDAAAVQREPRV